MNILVTGHRGFIGSNLVNQLKDHNVLTYEWGEPNPNVKGLDWVVHCGAISATTERNVDRVMTQNYDFSCWLLEECIKNKVNFQYSSSASVYGLNLEFKETSPVDPRTPYAWSKYMFERYANYRITNKIRIQGFRYFNVYGEGEDHKGGQASPYHQFEKQARENKLIKVFRNSDQYLRDFVPVKQVCQTHVDFFKVKESGIFNLGTGKTESFLSIAKRFGVEIQEIDMPEQLRHSYQTYTCADMTKTNKALGDNK
jgi:ADP-L-glycero-D-manno-heptose 6-epimerase